MDNLISILINILYPILSTSYPHFIGHKYRANLAFFHFSRYTTTTTNIYI
jgi:hypothetical protein